MQRALRDSILMVKCVAIVFVRYSTFCSIHTFFQYSAQWDDIFITRIADSEQDSSRFWGTLLNYQYVFIYPYTTALGN